MTVLLVLMGAFVLDFGLAYTNKRQAQTAADAAALAAATVYQGQPLTCDVLTQPANTPVWNQLKNDAKAEGDKLLAENLTSAKDVTFSVACDGENPKAFVVDYSVSKDSAIGLGRLAVDQDHLTVGRPAQATIEKGAPGAMVGGCALCFLGSLGIGNADYTVTGGDIHVNGNASTGATGHFTANKITVTGTTSGNFSPSASPGDPIDDPFASLAMPLPTTGLTNKSNPCGTGGTHGPGVYGDYAVNGTCTLQPGAYVFTGKLSLKNKDVLTGTGVTLYFKSPNGYLDVKNGEIQDLFAPTGTPAGAPSGWPSGVAIIYDRDNIQEVGLQGNGETAITGAVYAKSSTLNFNGNSCFGFDKGPVIVKSGTGNGTKGCVNLTNAHNVGQTQLPPAPDSLQLTK
jgi:hypothetical protein